MDDQIHEFRLPGLGNYYSSLYIKTVLGMFQLHVLPMNISEIGSFVCGRGRFSFRKGNSLFEYLPRRQIDGEGRAEHGAKNSFR
jgi:hypothetical protein